MPKNRGEFVRMLLLEKDKKEGALLRERRDKLKRPFENARQKELEMVAAERSTQARRGSKGAELDTDFDESRITEYDHGGMQAVPVRRKTLSEQQNHPRTWNHADLNETEMKRLYMNKEGDQLYRDKFGDVPYLRHTASSF